MCIKAAAKVRTFFGLHKYFANYFSLRLNFTFYTKTAARQGGVQP